MARPKKEVSAAPDKTRKISAVVNELKSKYPGRVFTAQEYTMPWLVKRLPTSILDLDIALGGGLPAGGMTFITGREGVGKNWLINQVIREHQQRHGDSTSVAVVSTEMVYDKEFAQLCGVKVALSDIEIAKIRESYEANEEPFTAEQEAGLREQIGEFITVPPSLAEESLQIAIDLIASREFSIVVIDSFGSLLTEHDDEGELSDPNRVGGAALLNTKFARKLNAALGPDKDGNPNLTCVVGVNQIRDNTDRANKYSPKTQEGGGWALKHARWVTIEMSRQAKVKDGDLVIGKTVRWEITKQKAGGHEGASGSFDHLHKYVGINRVAHSIAVSTDYGVMARKGPWYFYKGEQIGQGVGSAEKYVRDNGLIEKIEADTLLAANIRCSYGDR
jgi:recombination protein RecA